jgi:acyl carrier protein
MDQMARDSKLVNDVKSLIITSVNLHHMDPNTINDETSLREGGLELDSVDILEVVVAVEQQYGVKINDADVGKKYFRTIGTIADYLESHQK